MDKLFLVELSGGNIRHCELELPATDYELLDALDKLRLSAADKLYFDICDYYGYNYLAPFISDALNLYELNALSRKLADLNPAQQTAFAGLLKMEVEKRDGDILVPKLIDLAYSTDCCHVVAEAMNDSQLGRFYADNGFMEDECRGLGGCFLDYLSGQYRINLLEPRCWDDGSEPADPDAPAAFHGTLLAQHISFLRDVFRVYKGFDTPHIDTLELMVEKLYQKWEISDSTDFARMRPEDYPILSDLYEVIHDAYETYDAADTLYPKEMLRDLLLGLHSMCKGADSRFFNGHTNIDASKFLVFCVKGLDNVAANLRDTLLFSLLSYMSDQLLTAGNSVAAIDELYLWLSNTTVVTYIRNCLKRVRKKNSALILASQNLEDFDQPGIRELTRPLFSIPVHQFLFNGGNVDKKFFMENLQLEESEYALIRNPMRGSCLYKCGNERYLLQVQAPDYKKELFGTAGGR